MKAWPTEVSDTSLMAFVLVVCARSYVRNAMQAAQSDDGHVATMRGSKARGTPKS
ncbi:hypothetical protein GT037_005811 [Alternaria burnsii]|uniref:Uncharacterized protein n=1 Tax=Alternaria burnsii TaxID=1187904 RepID=A0A8H7B6Z8_9PLEO|nr:uncharacterized protein GT037_005811 [Alternaria burnsii]KAF7676306.1 hypothetical protein GT037_005811 [Alternaria burnsii]